jgi:ATP-dependent RNA helicase RhlE
MRNPAEVQVTPQNTAAERVEQLVYPVDKGRKRELLSQQIGVGNWRQVLVFTRTKHGANRLAEQLSRDGLNSVAIHGNKSQGARTKALADFKAGKVRVLVATDIAARGLDIDKLPHVVNFELPHVSEDYVHRIGRTARAGEAGHAVSLVCVDELKLLADIERMLGNRIPRVVVPGYEVDPSIRAEPITQGGGKRNSGGGRRSGGKREGADSRGAQNSNKPKAAAPRSGPRKPSRHTSSNAGGGQRQRSGGQARRGG